MSVTVKGMQELDLALKQATPKVQKKLQRKATRAAAKIVAEKVRQYVPVRTGLLRSRIKVRALPRTRKNIVGARVVSKAPHAHLIEFGTVKMEARWPQFRAGKDSKQQVVEVYGSEMRRLLYELR